MVSVDIGLTQAKRALKAKAKNAVPDAKHRARGLPACLLFAMGLEAKGTLRLDGEAHAVKAHLNTDRVEFRGGARLDIPFAAIRSAAAGAGGKLTITHAGGRAILELGDRAVAEKWALKITRPKGLIDKLGVKPGARVVVLGVDDPEFAAQLKERLRAAPGAKLAAGLDFIFYAADRAPGLAKLKTLRKSLQPAGAIWVVSLKGKAARIKDTDVMRAARAAGLVDNKVCSFSATHTALKLVIPKDQR